MNVDTGDMFFANEALVKLLRENGENVFQIPDELEADAAAEIKRQMIERTPLNLANDSPLSAWAAEKREEQKRKPDKKKNRRRMAKLSRARNR